MSPGTDPVSVLLHSFGIEESADQDVPSAAFCRLADLPEADSAGYVMHADPVHLRPDRDRLLLFDSHHLALSRDESAAMIDLFNRHFADDGLRLEAGASGRWYLQVARPPLLCTTPLYAAVGRSISELLPTGEDASAWARFLNETQMLFHHAEMNRVREREGRPTLSAIWSWGGGRVPGVAPPSRYARVYASDALAQGLAVVTKVPFGPVPDDATRLLESAVCGPVLVVWDGLWRPVLDSDGAGWMVGLEQLESWMVSLLGGRGGLGDAVARIYPCNGECLEVGAWGLRRFWRSPRAPTEEMRR